jgi:hypothetical protein
VWYRSDGLPIFCHLLHRRDQRNWNGNHSLKLSSPDLIKQWVDLDTRPVSWAEYGNRVHLVIIFRAAWAANNWQQLKAFIIFTFSTFKSFFLSFLNFWPYFPLMN